MKLSSIFQVVHPQYVYLRLKPNNSIRNNSTHKIARTIAGLHRNALQSIRQEEAKIRKLLGRSFLLPTQLSYTLPAKVSFLVVIEKQKVEFYFLLPKQHASLLRERMSDSWSNITIEQVDTLPEWSRSATKYQLTYTKEDALSLAVDRRNSELLLSTLNVIDVLQEGDRVGVLYNFIPTSQFTWRAEYRNTLQRVKDGVPVDRDKLGGSYMLKRTVTMLAGLVDLLSSVIVGSKAKTADSSVGLLEKALERLNGGRTISEATHRKANATVLQTQILVISQSADELRQRNNARSLAQAFDTVSDDNRLQARPYRGGIRYTDYRLRGAAINKIGDEEAQNFIALPGREVLERFGAIERVETQETEVPADLQTGVMRLGINTYRGREQMAYLSDDPEYRYLTLVLIGPTRAGKSTLIGNLSVDSIQTGECTVIFDFIKNCELSSEVAALFPAGQTLTIDCGDPRVLQGLGYNEVGISADPFRIYENAKKQATQLLTLINSVNPEDLTAKMERYLNSAALVVFIGGGSIRDVFGVLQDHKVRGEFVQRVPPAQAENLAEYVASLEELDEYQEVKIKDGRTTVGTERVLIGTKDHLVQGIFDRLQRLKQNTYMELMLKKSTAGNIDLVKELQKNQLITIRMPETMFQTDSERDVYCTYWLTKIWLALQIRGQQIPDRTELTKVNVVFDELYQVPNTERLLKTVLSRLAKFGAKPIISCHYINQIGQIRPELRSANASYMLISGCDKANYSELKSELYPYMEEDLLQLPRYHSLNLIKNEERYARFITRLPLPVKKS